MKTAPNTSKGIDPEVIAAAEEYLSRRDRRSHPDGDFDNAKRWYPSNNECCSCCEHIRNPSRSWPFSLMLHCRTAEHVASLYNVDTKKLRKAARLLDKTTSNN